MPCAAADGIQQLVVGGIVQHGNDVLLLKRPEADFMGGIWELPSGKVENSESLGQSLTREVLEETGLTVTDITASLGELRLHLRQRQAQPAVYLWWTWQRQNP